MVNPKREEAKEISATEHIIRDLKKLMEHLIDARGGIMVSLSAERNPDRQINPEKHKTDLTSAFNLAKRHLRSSMAFSENTEKYEEVLIDGARKLIRLYRDFGHERDEFDEEVLADCGTLKNFLNGIETSFGNMIDELESLEAQPIIDIEKLRGMSSNIIGLYKRCGEFVRSFEYLKSMEIRIRQRN